ncbi:MAG TPA: SDR family oxidoreductase [Pirellulales bacterium]|nr:SDR family oxidoreductase [Pirellulales bacterium]
MTKRILITGGSGGIGAALARRCAQAGAWPIVGYCRNAPRASAVIHQCGAGETLAIDLRREDLGLNGELPAVDAVVHCAAEYSPDRSLLAGPATAEELLRANVIGPMRLTAALAAKSSRLRQVLFMLSSSAFCRGTGPYALSKAAALAAARLMANELWPRGTQVDAVAPGWTDTPLAHRAAKWSGRTFAQVAAAHLDGRLLQPDDVAQVCTQWLFNRPAHSVPQLVVFDRRDSAEPVWQPLSAVDLRNAPAAGAECNDAAVSRAPGHRLGSASTTNHQPPTTSQ